jgi:hypothetical protein
MLVSNLEVTSLLVLGFLLGLTSFAFDAFFI